MSNEKVNMKPLKLLLALIGATLAVYLSYRFLISTVNPEVILLTYMGVATVCVFSYVIYNRGFSRKGITAEMLPESWSEEQKSEFIEDGKRRIKKTKPLLIVIIAFMFTFMIEAVELFVLPFLSGIFGA